MREEIFEYLIEHEQQTPKIATQMCDKFELHPDVMEEVYSYVQNGTFREENPVVVEGYTARRLKEDTYLQPIGAFNYLIYLRNKPEIALKRLRDGLPVR